MITKAIIEGMGVGTNRFYVRIPYFESAGEVEHAVYEATYCYTPGTVDTLNVGDVVFVGFEDHFSAKPVILGKLFTFGDYKGNSGATSVSSIDVSTKATLPKDTTIGGITADGIDALFRRVGLLETEPKIKKATFVMDSESERTLSAQLTEFIKNLVGSEVDRIVGITACLFSARNSRTCYSISFKYHYVPAPHLSYDGEYFYCENDDGAGAWCSVEGSPLEGYTFVVSYIG